MTDKEIREAFDTDFFWLLIRRFATAPAGESRDAAKTAILAYIGNNVGEREIKF